MFTHIKERLKMIARKLSERFPDRIVSVVAFGSRVRGDYGEWSDIDLLIVVKDKSPEVEKEIIDLIVDEEMRSGLSFSAVVKDLMAYEEEKKHKTPFYESIKQEGVLL